MLTATFPTPAWLPNATWRLLLPFASLHVLLLGYDLAHPDRFLRADRADERLKFILGLPEALRRGETLAHLGGHGVPGDWLPQGLVYLAGGQYSVIVLQVVLALLSIVWLRDIGRQVGLGERGAAVAAGLYALLPHSLVLPHQLSSEALFVPLVIFSFRSLGSGATVGSGVSLGIATLVRPLTLLWPLVQAAVLPLSPRARALLMTGAFAPLAGWMAFQFALSGEFSLGRSSHDLGANLYQRVGRMAASLPENERLAAQPPGERRFGIGQYMAFVLAHPRLSALHSASDFAALSVKSGIERLTLDYLDLFPQAREEVQDEAAGWRARAEHLGFFGALRQLGSRAPLLTATSAAGAALFIPFMLLAGFGAWHSFQHRQRLLLALFVVYVFITAQAVDAAQSRHRAPAEFALCLLALAGWGILSRRWMEKARDLSSRPVRTAAAC